MKKTLIAAFAFLAMTLASNNVGAQPFPSPTFQDVTILGTCTGCGGGGGGSLTLTDGSHTVTAVTHIAVTGGTVGGSTPNATLTITGGGAPGGSSGQTQYNNSGVLGGYTPNGACTVVPSTGVYSCFGSSTSLLPFTSLSGSATSAQMLALPSANLYVGNASNFPVAAPPSGDLSMNNSGTFTTTGLEGRPVSASAPANTNVLAWNGTMWAPTPISGGSGVVGAGTMDQIAGYPGAGTSVAGVTVTGDFTLLGSTGVGVLATVNGNVGTFASETVNGKGLVTAASNLSGDITTSGAVATLATVNSSPGSYTAANITVNGKGLVTVATNGSATPSSIFVGGPTSGTNTQVLTPTAPAGFSFTNGYVVRTTIGSQNTGAVTLNVDGTGAIAVAKATNTGLLALSGGELLANGQAYDFQAQTSCPAPISANCYVETTQISSGTTHATTSASGTGASPSLAQWAWGQFINLEAASLTATIPVSTTLASNGTVVINAINAGVLSSTAPDVIVTSAGSTAPGGTVTMVAGSVTVVTTDGAGHIQAAGNSVTGGGGSVSVTAGTSNVVITPSPGTGTFTVGTTAAGTAQSGASYTIASTDAASTVPRTHAGTMTDTLPNVSTSGFGAGFSSGICNETAFSDTLSVNSPSTLNGNASVVISGNTCITFANIDGTNYYSPTVAGVTGPGSSTNGFVPTWNGAGGSVLAAGLGVSSTKSNSVLIESTISGFIDSSFINFSLPEAIGWIAGQNPNNTPVFVAQQAMNITAIVGRVEVANGSAATVTVTKAASGTACSAGAAISTAFNANGTGATNQTITSGSQTLATGDTVCLQTTGGTNWNSGSSIGGITVFAKPS